MPGRNQKLFAQELDIGEILHYRKSSWNLDISEISVQFCDILRAPSIDAILSGKIMADIYFPEMTMIKDSSQILGKRICFR